jgi:hypothetical protein
MEGKVYRNANAHRNHDPALDASNGNGRCVGNVARHEPARVTITLS